MSPDTDTDNRQNKNLHRKKKIPDTWHLTHTKKQINWYALIFSLPIFALIYKRVISWWLFYMPWYIGTTTLLII